MKIQEGAVRSYGYLCFFRNMEPMSYYMIVPTWKTGKLLQWQRLVFFWFSFLHGAALCYTFGNHKNRNQNWHRPGVLVFVEPPCDIAAFWARGCGRICQRCAESIRCSRSTFELEIIEILAVWMLNQWLSTSFTCSMFVVSQQLRSFPRVWWLDNVGHQGPSLLEDC